MPFVVSCLPPSWVTPIDPAIEDADSSDDLLEDEREASAREESGKPSVSGRGARRGSKDSRRGSKDSRRGSKDKTGRKGSKDGGERRSSKESNGRKWSGGSLFLYSMSGSHNPGEKNGGV